MSEAMPATHERCETCGQWYTSCPVCILVQACQGEEAAAWATVEHNRQHLTGTVGVKVTAG